MTRPGRSPTRTPLGARELAAAAEAALGKPRVRAKSRPKATVEEVTQMAEAKFRRRNLVKPTKLKDTIRRVPASVPAKPRTRRGGNKMEPAAIPVS
jgi:hypothetical protein